MRKNIVLFSLISYIFFVQARGAKVLVCYVTSWSVYRPGEGKFSIDSIDPHLCTHIIYAYHVLNGTTWQLESDDQWADYHLGGIRKLVDKKKHNPYLKILVCIGGWSEGSVKFSTMASDKQKRQMFVDSVVHYLQKNDLDGLDIDWQFPGQRGGKVEDKDNFPQLLQDLRNEFNPLGYILTVRLMGSLFAAQGYHLPSISDAVHYINLKSYSYLGNWEHATGVNSPLKAHDQSNVEFSVNMMLSEGVSNEKLLLGLCTEGNALLLDQPVTDQPVTDQPVTDQPVPDQPVPDQPVTDQPVTDDQYIGRNTSGDFRGPWIDEPGVLGYNELCWLFKREGADWKHRWDAESSTPYSVKDNKFTSYDNQQSFHHKLELIEERELGGVSLFSIDKDDFNGLCHDQKYILTNTVRNHLSHYNLDVQILNKEYPR